MEASFVCKLFYHASRKNKMFPKKLEDSCKLFACDKWIFNSCCGDIFISFSNHLFVYLEKYVKKDILFLVKDILMDRLYHSVLPFHVWNHLFLCERSESMCGYCTKLYIKNKKVPNHINNNLFVPICDFPCQFKQGFTLTYKIPLYVHINIVIKNDRLYFRILLSESINSSLMLKKLYLDILSWIVFNVSHKFILPLLMSGSTDVNFCTNYTGCTYKNCLRLRKNKIEEIFFRELVESHKKLSEFCCDNVDPCFVIDVFKRYRKGVDFFSEYLDIERNE